MPRLSDDFDEYLRGRQSRVDVALRELFHSSIDGAPAALVRAMEYSLLASGKRVRPLLVMLGCEASGGSEVQALPAACAVEMVHTYSLIHDDLPAMDDDDLRRGLPTCHKQFGEALAILAGDALLTLAFQILTQRYPPATAAVSCLELAAAVGAAGMVGGQVLDLAAEERLGRESVNPRAAVDLESIHRRKTGALFRACLRLGLCAAQGERPKGPDLEIKRRLDRYGEAFGLMFQIADDLLDVEGTAEQLGKRAGKDAGRGKLTYPGLLGVAESRKRAEALCAEAVAAVEGLGPAARPLMELAQFVIERDR
jgi:geranylgeranyl diphosphate synthase type II